MKRFLRCPPRWRVGTQAREGPIRVLGVHPGASSCEVAQMGKGRSGRCVIDSDVRPPNALAATPFAAVMKNGDLVRAEISLGRTAHDAGVWILRLTARPAEYAPEVQGDQRNGKEEADCARHIVD